MNILFLVLVDHIKDMETRMYGLTRKNVLSLAYQLAAKNNIPPPFKGEKAGNEWLRDLGNEREPLTKTEVEKFYSTLKDIQERKNWTNPGHVKEECRKFAKIRNNSNSSPTTISVTPKNRSTEIHSNSNTISCYGCGTVDYVNSNCLKCHPKPVTNEFMYNSIDCNQSVRPLIPININGHQGCAFADTGSKTTLAGSMLSTLLIQDGIPHVNENLIMTLADGAKRNVEAQIFEVNVKLHNKIIPTRFVAVPHHVNSRTLLGTDFLKHANVILDIPNNKYYFGEYPQHQFSFTEDLSHLFNETQREETILRNDEGVNLALEERNQLHFLLVKLRSCFEKRREPTPFAEHSIDLLDQTPIAVPPYRMFEIKKQLLQQEVDKLLQNGIIEECESPYAAPVFLAPEKNNSIRLTVDYRTLNTVTCADRYPLPRIDDILHAAKKTNYTSLADEWLRIKDNIQQLTTLRISRYIPALVAHQVRIIGFSDASVKGYGAVIYLQTTIVLAWLRNKPYELKQYVGSRVIEMLEAIPPQHWHHIAGEMNSIDISSRGLNPKDLVKCFPLWHGPIFLHELPFVLPHINAATPLDIPELSINIIQVRDDNELINFMSQVSTRTKLERIFSYVLRFINHYRGKQTRGSLKVCKLDASQKLCVKLLQQHHFGAEIELLKKEKTRHNLRGFFPHP
ncbi:hypothetical protein FQR65_LT14406 [Abscondita terminalis]|nr:hypothetical protein FQR65_LT14406 [Abscondita terminalis]